MNVTFVFKGSGNWKVSSADDWECSTVELDNSEKILGHHKIDGAICKVVLTSDNQIIAISK